MTELKIAAAYRVASNWRIRKRLPRITKLAIALGIIGGREMNTQTREQVVQFQDAKESWESRDDWRFADREAAWKYFFEYGRADLKAQLKAAQEENELLRAELDTHTQDQVLIAYLQDQLASAEQRTAEACAEMAYQGVGCGPENGCCPTFWDEAQERLAEAIRSGEWRKFYRPPIDTLSAPPDN